MSPRIAAAALTFISIFNALQAHGDASAPGDRKAVPKCDRKQRALGVGTALAFRSDSGAGQDKPWTVRGRLVFAGEVCTAGEPPYCVGELALVQLPTDAAGHIALDARRVGLPIRCGLTHAAGGQPARSDCAPPDLLDQEVELRGILHSGAPYTRMTVESLCRR